MAPRRSAAHRSVEVRGGRPDLQSLVRRARHAAPLRLQTRPRELCQPLPQGATPSPPPKRPARSLTPNSPPIRAAACSAAWPRSSIPSSPTIAASMSSGYGGETVAFTETTMPLRFSPATLATLGVFGYEPALNGQVSTAHPHYDAARKRHYNYMVEFGLNSRLPSVQPRRRRQPGAGRRDRRSIAPLTCTPSP